MTTVTYLIVVHDEVSDALELVGQLARSSSCPIVVASQCVSARLDFLAETYEAVKIVSSPQVPYAERLVPDLLAFVHTDAVVRLDPDERLSRPVLRELERQISDSSGVGVFVLPFQYFFGRRPLRGTAWGGIRWIPRGFRIGGCLLPLTVHSELQPTNGYAQAALHLPAPIEHRWVSDWSEFIKKHRNYLGCEGESQHARGERSSVIRSIRRVLGAGYHSLVKTAAWRDGPLGLALSAAFVVYVFLCDVALWRVERLCRSQRGSCNHAENAWSNAV